MLSELVASAWSAVRVVFGVALGLVLGAQGLLAQAQPGQTEFVPVDQLPPTEQLPAAPLLIAAYAFVWVALLGYVWLTWRRLGRVEHDLHELARRQSQRKP